MSSSENKKVSLSEIATIHDSKRIPLNSRERSERRGDIPYYGAQGVIDYVDDHIFEGDFVLIAEDGENLRSKKLPVAFRANGKFWVNNHAHIVKGSEDWINDYIEAFFNYSDISPYITGAAQPKLNQANLLKIKLPFDELTAKEASLFWKLFQRKIELNRKTNVTLEQIGQTLFKKYFIDNPEREGWVDGTILDLGSVITGKTPSKSDATYYGNDVMFLKVPDMHNTIIVIKTADNLSKKGADSQSNKYIPKWSTCVSCIATVGVVSLAGDNLQTNQQINSVMPKNEHYTFFNYFLLKSKSDFLHTMASAGSATPNLNKGQFEKIKVHVPPQELLSDFNIKIKSHFEKIYNNYREIETLSEIRDNLLPKLMSGEVTF
jgi:type I restriction enzyme S subunit